MTEFIKRLITASFFSVTFWSLFIFFSPIIFALFLGAVLLLILAVEWPQLLKPKLMIVLTPLYPILPFALLITLNQNPIFHNLLFYLFFMVFACDTGSYLAGINFGRTKLMPKVSPNKTWEGFFGGYLLTVFITLLGTTYFKAPAGVMFILGFALLCCALALAGDLFESWLKRRAGLKDTSSLLPGHGGLLDRFDSILFVTFLFYFFRNYLAELLL